MLGGGATEQVWQSRWKGRQRADSVVFINDVYFCAGDLIRLLRHDADLACGLDFWTSTDFYDVWVSRDAIGGMLSVKAPFVRCVTIIVLSIVLQGTKLCAKGPDRNKLWATKVKHLTANVCVQWADSKRIFHVIILSLKSHITLCNTKCNSLRVTLEIVTAVTGYTAYTLPVQNMSSVYAGIKKECIHKICPKKSIFEILKVSNHLGYDSPEKSYNKAFKITLWLQ